MFQGCFLLTVILTLVLLCYSANGDEVVDQVEISPSGSTRTFGHIPFVKIFNLIGIVTSESESKSGPVSETKTEPEEELTTFKPLHGHFNNQKMNEGLQNRFGIDESWTIPRLGWDYDNM